jgi:hypothetical protein
LHTSLRRAERPEIHSGRHKGNYRLEGGVCALGFVPLVTAMIVAMACITGPSSSTPNPAACLQPCRTWNGIRSHPLWHSPQDLDAALMHDCFTFEVIQQPEEAFARTSGDDFVLDSYTRLGIHGADSM